MSVKLTVITDKNGKLVAASYGHIDQPDHTTAISADNRFQGGLLAGPDQHLHLIEAHDDLAEVTSPKEFHSRIETELAKRTK